MIYATASTAAVFLLGIVLLPWAYRKGVLTLRTSWPLVAYLLYFGVLHVPFTIQARYTTSVRFVLLILLAVAIHGLWTGRGTRSEESDGTKEPA